MTGCVFTRDVTVVTRALRSGQVAIVPTDTVYGIAASLDNRDAIKRIYAAKGRPDDKSIPILVDGLETAEHLTGNPGAAAGRLMRSLWPGALTLVLPASAHVPDECRALDGTVGLRMPDHATLRTLLRACGGALAVTSANRSGEPETNSPAEAYAALSDYVDIVLDCGLLPTGPPSTVVDPRTNPPRIIRRGAIDSERIFAAAAGQ